MPPANVAVVPVTLNVVRFVPSWMKPWLMPPPSLNRPTSAPSFRMSESSVSVPPSTSNVSKAKASGSGGGGRAEGLHGGRQRDGSGQE